MKTSLLVRTFKICMSMRSGRKKKTQNFKTSPSHSSSRFDQHKFCSLLKQVGGNPSNWSLKKEWGIFYRMYFNTSWADTRYAMFSSEGIRKSFYLSVIALFIKRGHIPVLTLLNTKYQLSLTITKYLYLV